MRFRNHYVCACGQTWSITADDNLEGECPECGKKSWPVEIIDQFHEAWELCGQPRPPCPKPDATGFAQVFEQTTAGMQHVLPSVAPVSTASRVQLEADRPYSERRDRFAKARPMDVGLWDETARNQLDLFGASNEPGC